MKHINQMMAGVLLLIAGNTAAVGQVLTRVNTKSPMDDHPFYGANVRATDQTG